MQSKIPKCTYMLVSAVMGFLSTVNIGILIKNNIIEKDLCDYDLITIVKTVNQIIRCIHA